MSTDSFKKWVFDNIFTIMFFVFAMGGMWIKMQVIDERLSNIEKALGVGEVKYFGVSDKVNNNIIIKQ